jgi:ABC-2 type transport system permease protein
MSAPRPAPTDRGAWLLVARRDFRVRLRDKGFAISTAITLSVLSIFIFVKAYAGGGTPSYELGVVGTAAAGMPVAAVAEQQGIQVRVRSFPDDPAGLRALSDGAIDALLEGDRLIGQRDVPQQLRDVLQTSAAAGRIQAALADAGASSPEIARLLDPHPLQVQTVEPVDAHRDSNAGVAFIGVFLLYGQLFGYGVWVATGVIEEKASRVVEVLLSAISPRQLLTGKVVGIGSLGVVQLGFIATFAIVLAKVTGALSISASAVGVAVLVLAWFVLGFAFYAGLFAVSGALVSRMEELQNATVPINIIILVSFFISVGAVQRPDAPVVVLASLLPFSAALAMPVRIVVGAATAPQIVASVLILLGSTALLIPLAGRIYAGAVLRTGARVRLRDAWRAAR